MTAARSYDQSWEARIRLALNEALQLPGVTLEVLESHRRDHLLGWIRGAPQGELFFKAFSRGALTEFMTERSVYEQLEGSHAAPRLVLSDLKSLLLITEAVTPRRLCDLDADGIRGVVSRIPPLYEAVVGLRSCHAGHGRGARLKRHYSTIRNLIQVNELPQEAVLLEVLENLPELPVHGDFQPSNVLVNKGSLTVVDFESYGPGLASVDVARMAYNPLLPFDAIERAELTAEMLARIAFRFGVKVSPRQFAASCVYWAITCSSYFTRVRELSSEAPSADILTLSTRPLELASQLWNETD